MTNSSQQSSQQYKVLPASHGFNWVKDGTELLRGNFGRWAMLFLLYLVLAMFSTIHVLTSVLFFLFNPVLWGGIFLAGGASIAKLEWTPSILFEPLKKHASVLLKLGGVIAAMNYLIAMALISHLTTLIDIQELDKILNTVRQTNDTGPFLEFFSDPNLVKDIMLSFLIALLVALPLTMAGWFAPVLIMEKGLSPLQALKTSFQACSANFLSFLVYGLVGLVLMMFVIVSMYIALIFIGPIFFSSYYCSYEDIFSVESFKPVDVDDDESNSTFVV